MLTIVLVYMPIAWIIIEITKWVWHKMCKYLPFIPKYIYNIKKVLELYLNKLTRKNTR